MSGNQDRKVLPVTPFNPLQDSVWPKEPDIKRPDAKNLLDRMKRTDPNLAKKYKQRSGE